MNAIRILVAAATVALLAACGGGGGGGGGGGSSAGSGTVAGGAIKGPLYGADICVYALANGAIGAQVPVNWVGPGAVYGDCYRTEADGGFQFSVPQGTTGDFVVESLSGTFCSNELPATGSASCPSGGVAISLANDSMRTIVSVSATGGTRTAYLTPLSTAAVDALAGSEYSAAAFGAEFARLADLVLGPGSGVTPSTPPSTATHTYLGAVSDYLLYRGLLRNAVIELAQGTSTMPPVTSTAVVAPAMNGTYELQFNDRGGVGCGSVCPYAEGQTATFTINGNVLTIPGGTMLANPFYWNVTPNFTYVYEVAWRDSATGAVYRVSDPTVPALRSIVVTDTPGNTYYGIWGGTLAAGRSVVASYAGNYAVGVQQQGAPIGWTSLTIGADASLTFNGAGGPTAPRASIRAIDVFSSTGTIDLYVNFDVGTNGVDWYDKITLYVAGGVVSGVAYYGSPSSPYDTTQVTLVPVP